jgi:hypothetical protein
MSAWVVAAVAMAPAGTSHAFFADNFNHGTDDGSVGNGWVGGFDVGGPVAVMNYNLGGGVDGSQGVSNSGAFDAAQIARDVTSDVAHGRYEVSALLNFNDTIQLKIGSTNSQLGPGPFDGHIELQIRSDKIFAGVYSTAGGFTPTDNMVAGDLELLGGGNLGWDWRDAATGYFMAKLIVDFDSGTGQPTQVEAFLGDVDDTNDNIKNPTFMAGRQLVSIGTIGALSNVTTATSSDLALSLIAPSAGVSFFDNVVSGVPEPASPALLGFGGLMPIAADHPLKSMSNVVLTPHSASVSAREITDCFRHSVDALRAMADGRLPASCVNPQVLPRCPFK